MRGGAAGTKRFVGALAALAVLTHCAGESAEPFSAPPSRSTMPRTPPPLEQVPPVQRPPETGEARTGWVKQYGGKGPERLHALATDAAGGFVAAGLFGDTPFPGELGLALARYAADGTPEWTQRVSEQNVRARALALAPGGELLVAGSYDGAPDLGLGPLPRVLPAQGGLFLARFSSTGRALWTRGFAAEPYDVEQGVRRHGPVTPEALATDAEGNLLVVGRFHNLVSFGDEWLFAGLDSITRSVPRPGGFIAKFDARGEHVWSRAIEAKPDVSEAWLLAVSTTPQGQVLVGGRVSAGADLGDGVLEHSAPFIARYDARGRLEWKRLFTGEGTVSGAVGALQPLSTGDVAFTANLGGTFSFNGQPYTGGFAGNPWYSGNGVTGILRTTGTDGWLLELKSSWLFGLAAAESGAYTVTGVSEASSVWLGDRRLESPQGEALTPFAVRLLAGGGLAWARALDPRFTGNLRGQEDSRLQLAPQPGGRVLLGGDFQRSVLHDGTAYAPRGASDLFYLQLGP